MLSDCGVVVLRAQVEFKDTQKTSEVSAVQVDDDSFSMAEDTPFVGFQGEVGVIERIPSISMHRAIEHCLWPTVLHLGQQTLHAGGVDVVTVGGYRLHSRNTHETHTRRCHRSQCANRRHSTVSILTQIKSAHWTVVWSYSSYCNEAKTALLTPQADQMKRKECAHFERCWNTDTLIPCLYTGILRVGLLLGFLGA